LHRAVKSWASGIEEIFDSLAGVRMKLPDGMTTKDLIEEGRRFYSERHKSATTVGMSF